MIRHIQDKYVAADGKIVDCDLTCAPPWAVTWTIEKLDADRIHIRRTVLVLHAFGHGSSCPQRHCEERILIWFEEGASHAILHTVGARVGGLGCCA